MPDWKKQRGWLNRTLEKVEDLPMRAFTRDRPITDSAKRELYEKGIVGQAEILDAPGERSVSDVQVAHGTFRFRVEVPGQVPYEVKSWQDFGRYEWERMRPGAVVECRVHPDNPQRVLLVVPEPDEVPMTMMDSSQIVAKGKRANGTVLQSARLDRTAPGSGDPLFLIRLELRAGGESAPWTVQIGQRVPKGAEDMVADGSSLEAAYMEVDGGDSVAIDWRASSDGRFS